ncbi:hypothetical protein D3C81_1665570 [compost metagenome]
MLALLGPEHDDAAHHQGSRHCDGVEQVMMDKVGEQHTENHCRHEGYQQVDGKALCAGLTRQADDHIEDLAPKFPDHRQDRPQLNNDVEGHGPLATKVDHVGYDDLVASTGDGQKLRKPFDNP